MAVTSLSKGKMEIDSRQPPKAFYVLRPWGQTNLYGDELPGKPSSQRRIFGGFNSKVKHPSLGTAEKAGWRLN